MAANYFFTVFLIILTIFLLAIIVKKTTSSANFSVIKPYFIKRNALNHVSTKKSTYFSKSRYAYPAQSVLSNPPIICILSLGGSYKISDLKTYWNSCGLSDASFAVPIFHAIDGVVTAPNQNFGSSSSDFSGASLENTLDLEIAMTLCPAAKMHFFSGPNTIQGFYNTFNAAKFFLIGQSNTKCKIISISWGINELSLDPITILKFNASLKNALASGISTCVASGDNSSDDGVGILSVDFPSSSPHVIACGGSSYNGQVESAWSYNFSQKWGGGGGYSMFFEKPTYQMLKVTPQSSTALIGSALLTNRSVPDIALNADPLNGWEIYFNGEYVTVGGTSCVSPAFSAFLGLCNKPSSAYNLITNVLTPLYAAPASCFNDITLGSNTSLNLNGLYNAVTGYDQCTGLGSIIGTSLIAYL